MNFSCQSEFIFLKRLQTVCFLKPLNSEIKFWQKTQWKSSIKTALIPDLHIPALCNNLKFLMSLVRNTIINELMLGYSVHVVVGVCKNIYLLQFMKSFSHYWSSTIFVFENTCIKWLIERFISEKVNPLDLLQLFHFNVLKICHLRQAIY